MRIFAADVGQLYAHGVIASETVRALLAYAVEKTWHTSCPAMAKHPNGKPYFPDHPDKFFSLSHSKSHVLVALSEQDVGADIETLREIKGSPERLFSREMLADFGYFGGWTLRESVFKLTGEGSLRRMEFRLTDGEISTPFGDVFCRLYREPDCVIAISAHKGIFPDKVEYVDIEDFWT